MNTTPYDSFTHLLELTYCPDLRDFDGPDPCSLSTVDAVAGGEEEK